VIKSGNRSQCDEKIDFVFPVGVRFGQLVEHLGSSLRVTYICDLVTSSMLSHIVNLSRSIEVAHLGEAELPEGLVFVGVKRLMPHTILRTSLISKPHIVSLSY